MHHDTWGMAHHTTLNAAPCMTPILAKYASFQLEIWSGISTPLDHMHIDRCTLDTPRFGPCSSEPQGFS